MLKEIVKYVLLPLSLITSSPSNSSAENYSVSQIIVPIGQIEYRLKKDERHFATVISDFGAFVIRPHPGDDINGWGSSLYMQPFLPGAILKHSNIESVVASETGVSVNASGKVSQGNSFTFGDWQFNMDFSYNRNKKEIIGEGQYSVQIPQPLTKAKVDSGFVRINNPILYRIIKENPKLSFGDLNLYKLASNYLNDVPLLGNGIGDTGDMKYVEVVLSNPFLPSFVWNPPLMPGHFPGDIADNISVNTLGQYNNVDTVAQGYPRIEPAYKPSLKVDIHSKQLGIPMIFGGIYELNHSQDFWEDNIGITPLILKGQTTLTNFDFDISFQSDANVEPRYFSLFDFSNDWYDPTNPSTPKDLIELLEGQ